MRVGLGLISKNVIDRFFSAVGDLRSSPWIRQPEPITKILPYLDFVTLSDGTNAVLMQDGGLAIAW